MEQKQIQDKNIGFLRKEEQNSGGGGVNFLKYVGCIFKNQNLQKIYVEKYQLILYHVRLSTTLF